MSLLGTVRLRKWPQVMRLQISNWMKSLKIKNIAKYGTWIYNQRYVRQGGQRGFS